MNPILLLIEIGATAFFALASWLALRRGRLPFLELVSAALFGLMLEQANQVIYETYEYSPDFVLAVDRSPIVIGLTWAFIIAGAMRITDALGVRGRYAAVVDSVLAIMLDLAFDAVAIRMGLWTWRDIGPHEGWFGVPAGNFYSWLFVTLGFTLFTRLLRDVARDRRALEWLQLLVPLPAFVVLTAGIVVFAILKPLVDPAPAGGLLIFWIALASFTALSAWAIWGPDRVPPDGAGEAILDLRLAFVTRLAIHLFFLVALVAIGLAVEEPILLVVSLARLAADLGLAALAHRRHALGLAA
ncbi:MAG TPA: carotenoid biosynthesis protein [Candidatus Binatia bacterium]|nr:carotenoid biosynthesis protein [Candidatus Binatia bacterium]